MDRLVNTVRPYAWGSVTALPEFLGTKPSGEPQAELWLGAHPGAPSVVDRGAGRESLADLIEADPEGELGAAVHRAFGPRLPFLLKVLAAASPLSLQVHPDRQQASAGYADEEARGVPLNAPHRTYKDANHKPELLCALTPFTGLCGFRHPREAAGLLTALDISELAPYLDLLSGSHPGDALRATLTALLTADRAGIAGTVERASDALARLAGQSGPHATAYAAYAGIARHYPGDPGVLAAMLLHVVRLQPGEALYLGAGVPHAYLYGTGIEIMANSDNVLRCGLTPKHMDIPELLRIVRFEPGSPAVLRPAAAGEGEELYAVPVADFRFSRYRLHPGDSFGLGADTPQILLCADGTVSVQAGPDAAVPLDRGESVFVPAGEHVRLAGQGTLFRATVAN